MGRVNEDDPPEPSPVVYAGMLARLQGIAHHDAVNVHQKNIEYGESWCKRGGGQAFSVIWRKVDRIESILKRLLAGYDIFRAWKDDTSGIRDDIRDLRQYLLLLEEYLTREEKEDGNG